jgi:hypothetical protein
MAAAILCDRQTRAAYQGENSHRNQKIAHEHAFLPTPGNTAARQKFRLSAPRDCYGRGCQMELFDDHPGAGDGG